MTILRVFKTLLFFNISDPFVMLSEKRISQWEINLHQKLVYYDFFLQNIFMHPNMCIYE